MKIRLSESTFTLIPEGVHTFKVVEVNDERYDDFGKLEVKLQTAKGSVHVERFSLMKDSGELNEGALRAWSYFTRTCLNNFHVEEIDSQDLVGCYIKANVKHETYTRTKGEKAGQTATVVRLGDYSPACGFESPIKTKKTTMENTTEDLDDFLDM